MIVIEVYLPKAQIQFLCADRKPMNQTYKLSPSQIQPIIDAVRRANDSQIHIRDDRNKNAACLEDLEVYNYYHPEATYTPEDLVRMIDLQHYDSSFIGTKEPYVGVELHAFENIEVPGFTRRSNERVYVKLTTPDSADNIEVVSLHRGSDRGRRWDPRYPDYVPDYDYSKSRNSNT